MINFRVVCEEWGGYLFTVGRTYLVTDDRIISDSGTSFPFSSNVENNGTFRRLPLTKLDKALA